MRPIIGAHILLTERCNFNCKYCFVRQNPNTMDWPTLKASIDWLLDHADKRLNITWFGGEPLLCWELMMRGTKYLQGEGKQRGIQVACGPVTNGSLLTPDRVVSLKSTNQTMLFSYDGPNVQPLLRGGTVDAIENNLKMCIDRGIRVSVAMQAAAGHTNYLAEDYMHIRKLGVRSVAINPVVHCYAPYSVADWKNIRSAMERVAEYEFERMMAGEKCGYVQMSGQLSSILAVAQGRDLKAQRTDYACGACKGSLAIDPEGNIMPCQQMSCAGGWAHHKIGNVLTGEYDPNKRKTFVSESIDAWNDCSKCAVLRCAPCRTINYAVTGNELQRAPDSCKWQRELFEVSVLLHNQLVDAGYYKHINNKNRSGAYGAQYTRQSNTLRTAGGGHAARHYRNQRRSKIKCY